MYDHQVGGIAAVVAVHDVLLVLVIKVASLVESHQSSNDRASLILDTPLLVSRHLVEI